MLKNILAHTIAEVLVSIAIFSLLMLGTYSAIDIGFRIWQLGEVKTDFYGRAKIILSYITKDFKYSSWISAKMDHDGDPNMVNEYIAFETPVREDGSISIDPKNGKPLWQRYMYYFIFPSVEDEPTAVKRDLYCRIADRNPKNSIAMPLPSFPASYLSNKDASEDSALSGTILRIIGKEIYGIDFQQVGTGLMIAIKFKAKVSEHSLVMFDNKNVSEVIELKASVIPEN